MPLEHSVWPPLEGRRTIAQVLDHPISNRHVVLDEVTLARVRKEGLIRAGDPNRMTVHDEGKSGAVSHAGTVPSQRARLGRWPERGE